MQKKIIASLLAVAATMAIWVNATSAAARPEMPQVTVQGNTTIVAGKGFRMEASKVNENTYMATLRSGKRENRVSVAVEPMPVGAEGFRVVVTDLDAQKVVLSTVTQQNPFVAGPDLRIGTVPKAAIIWLVGGGYQNAASGAGGYIAYWIFENWWPVIEDLYSEGYGLWAIAGLLISAAPELLAAFGFAVVL